MITIHEKTAQKFDTLGLGALLPSSCVVTEEINGACELKLSHPYDEGGKWKRIERGRILYASTPRGMQPFRIYNTKPNMSGIEVNARHIFYDLLDNQCSEISFNGTASGALAALQGAFAFPMPFSFDTDISVSGTLKTGRMNPVQALLSDDDETTSFVKGFGGELLRDGFNVSLLSVMGQDRDVTIRYGKNLVGLDVTEDEADVKTRIQYHGSDGSGTLDSPFINEYVYPKIHTLEDENKTRAELKAEAQALFDGGADLPLVNIKVDFITLADTVEYADYAPLEEVFLGDIVTIINQKMNFAKRARVISYEWDCLLEKYNEVELGDFMPTLASSVTSGVRSGSLASAAAVGTSAVSAALQAHLNDFNNPHKTQTGGGSGTGDADAVLDLLEEHEADKDNPHSVTAAQVGAYTTAEVDEKLKNVSGAGISYGTEAPDDAEGDDGDVYLQIGGETHDANTLLLIHGNEVVDNSNYKRALANINISPVTVDKSINEKVLSFGSGKKVYTENGGFMDLGTGDFTIEWREYVLSTTPDPGQVLAMSDINTTRYFNLEYYPNGKVILYVSGETVTTSFDLGSFEVGKWVHRALVRCNGKMAFYKDGTKQTEASYTDSFPYYSGSKITFGSSYGSGQASRWFDGYMEEIRISNVARWTANFTPPIEPYAEPEVGSLWLKQNGAWTQVLKGAA